MRALPASAEGDAGVAQPPGLTVPATMSQETGKPAPSGFLDSRLQAIQGIVRTTYEHPSIVSRYTTVGLWPAEEILVLDYVPEGARVLDLGCGAGRTAVALAEMGLDVVGIDTSASMVQAAREQARLAGVSVSFQVMDAMVLDGKNPQVERSAEDTV